MPYPALASPAAASGADVAAPRANLPSLTGLRWIAAMLVFGCHLKLVEYVGDGWFSSVISAVFGAGSTGVSFFFVLSGFVLMWAWRPMPYGQFYLRRFARVYPLHLATGVIALGVIWCAGGPTPPFSVLIGNATLTQSWLPDSAYYQSLNTVSWTLSCEAFFYALFPLLAVWTGRLGRRGLCGLAGAAVAVVLVGPLLVGAIFGAEAADWFFHWNPVGRLPEFVVGIVLCRLVALGDWAPSVRFWWKMPVAVSIAVLGYVGSSMAPAPYNHAACTLVGYSLLIMAVAYADIRGSRTLLRGARMVRLGEISFAFYLIHLLVMRLVEIVVGYHPRLTEGVGIPIVMLTAAVIFFLAWALNVHVERPAQRFLTRLPLPAPEIRTDSR